MRTRFWKRRRNSARLDHRAPKQLLLLSARTATALETMTANLSRHLEEHPEIDLADVAFTLKTGRKSFNHRRMLVCDNTNHAIKELEDGLTGEVSDSLSASVVFMFPGQGAQHVNMGRNSTRLKQFSVSI